MKITKNIVLIIAGALIVIGLILCGISFAITGGDFMVYDTSDKYTERKCEYDASDIKEIVLDETSNNVRFISSDDKKIHITVYESEKTFYEIEVRDDDVLNINYQSNKKWYDYIGINIDLTQVYTTIAVPDGFKGSIHSEISSGKVKADEININGEISFNATSGEVYLSNTKVTGSLKIDTNSGHVELSDCIAGSNITVECSSGDVDLKNITGKNYSLKTNSGSIDGRSLISQNNGSLIADASSGRISINNSSFDGDMDIECNSGDIKLDMVSADNISLNTSSGSIKAIFDANEKDYHIQTDSSSGSINAPHSSNGKKALICETKSGDINVRFK